MQPAGFNDLIELPNTVKNKHWFSREESEVKKSILLSCQVCQETVCTVEKQCFLQSSQLDVC